jgi:hypothetical protein
MKHSVGKPEGRDERTGRRWADNIKVEHHRQHPYQQFISYFMVCFIFMDVGLSVFSLVGLRFFFWLKCIRAVSWYFVDGSF